MTYCDYGPRTGLPAFSLAGTPGTRWERPDVIEAFVAAGLRVIVPDRPGYGGSTRQPGRTVGDVAADVRMIADALGWQRFAVTGFSGGGPHALACAALLGSRVNRCAAVSSPAPSEAPGVDFFRRETPEKTESFRLASVGEQALRPYLTDRAAQSLAELAAGEAELASGEAADGGRTARRRAMYLGLDGWIDDDIALVHPWGFGLDGIATPVSVWRGLGDLKVPRRHSDWLLAHIPGAEGYEYPGRHEPGDADYRRVLTWLAAA
jgi:pimeloyl-ACP methyl ester carboxylesterase